MHKPVEQAIRFFKDSNPTSKELKAAVAQGRTLAREVLRLTQLVSKTNKQINHTCSKLVESNARHG
jgi:hypothetical protein